MLMFKDKYTTCFASFFFCVLIIFTPSCKRTPTSPSGGFPLLTSTQFRDIVLNVVDYDVVQVTNFQGVDFRSTNVARLVLGEKDSTTFKPLLSVPSTYDANANEFIIHFDFKVALDSTKILAPLTLRYYSPDFSYTDIDTTVDLLHYPYASAEVFVTNAIFPQPDLFQDISRVGNTLYFHGYGPDGLNKYDLMTHQSALLYAYPSGDHIAADSSYVYCDVAHDHIDRYNVLTGAVDRSFLAFAPYWLCGVALYSQRLFVLVGDNNYAMNLKTFDVNGTLIDSIPYPTRSYYMTFYDSVMYGVDVWTSGPNVITRFDLRTKSYLPNLLSPAKSCSGIKVFGDQIYYCNVWKQFLGVMPIADLRPVHGTPTHTTNSRTIRRAPNQSLPKGVQRAHKLTASWKRSNVSHAVRS